MDANDDDSDDDDAVGPEEDDMWKVKCTKLYFPL